MGWSKSKKLTVVLDIVYVSPDEQYDEDTSILLVSVEPRGFGPESDRTCLQIPSFMCDACAVEESFCNAGMDVFEKSLPWGLGQASGELVLEGHMRWWSASSFSPFDEDADGDWSHEAEIWGVINSAARGFECRDACEQWPDVVARQHFPLVLVENVT